MRRTSLARGVSLALLVALLIPSIASAQDAPPDNATIAGNLDLVWVVISAGLVLFMQAGFLGLEVGFSRGKNVGAGVAKIVINLAIAGIVWWMVGFGFAFGGTGEFLGTSTGFFSGFGSDMSGAASFPLGLYGDSFGGGWSAFHIFQFAFAAVSLAIVWGTTIERIKFIAMPIFAVVFIGFIYPLIAHWGFGGGFFTNLGGVQDFAGSTVVHLTGATAAFAALLVLGPRRGKYTATGEARAIPGHNMPIFGLGVIILWLGWIGFNGGSTLGVADGRFAEVAVVTNLGAAGGVVGASIVIGLLTKKLDVGMAGNGAIAGLVAITAPSGYVEFWAAPIIGLVAGVIVVFGVLAIDKKLDDPVGALSAHGLAGIWGTLACGLFTSNRLSEYNGVGQAGLFEGGGFKQLGTQALGAGSGFLAVFILSFAVFKLVDVTIGLRVDEATEDAGLDITEHGMYGYPEQFIPAPELVGYGAAPTAPPSLSGQLATTKETLA